MKVYFIEKLKLEKKNFNNSFKMLYMQIISKIILFKHRDYDLILFNFKTF